LRAATPEEFVVALPTLVAFSLKAIDLPLITALVLAFRRVADSVTVPPNVPAEAATLSVVAGSVLTGSTELGLVFVRCFVSPR